MIGSLVLMGVLAQGLQQDKVFPNETLSTRLKRTYPNGAMVLVDRIAGESRMAATLLIGSQGVEESAETHGWRHLLEHLMARGKGGDLDQRLLSRGSQLRALTTRDTMAFTIAGPRTEWQRAVASLNEMIHPSPMTAEQIAKEAKIMEQELALTEDSRTIGAAAWRYAFGPAGLDPEGDLATMAGANPDLLASFHRQLVNPRNLVIHVVGDFDLDQALNFAGQLLAELPKGPTVAWRERPSAQTGRATADAYGDARAAVAPAFGTPKSLGVLAAGLAVASEYGGGFFTYTPSARPGLAITGQTLDRVGMTTFLDQADAASLYRNASWLLQRWIDRLEGDLGRLSQYRALAAMQGLPKLEDLRRSAKSLDYKTFEAGLDAYGRENGIVVVGTK